MANTYLIDIGLNDTPQNVIRKCNHNFRRLATDQSKQSKSDIRQEADRTDAMVTGVVETINALEGEIEKIRESVQSLVPKVGSVLIYADKTDPNEIYKGTTWERIEGRFLLASDDDHPIGSEGGQGETTLTTENLPNHNHSMSHTHQYDDTYVSSIQGHALTASEMPAHAHGLNGHTHAVSGSTINGIKYGLGNKWDFGISGDPNFGGIVHTSHGGSGTLATGGNSGNTTSAGGGGSHTHGVNQATASRTTGNSVANTGTTGAGEPVDIMPPYESVNVWKRVA